MTTATAPDLARLTGTWTIDPSHSSLEFSTRHAMVTTVRGRFTDFSGTLTLDGSDPSGSAAVVEARLDSVNTGDEKRDGHLRSADFFDVENHPVMTFRSTKASAGRSEDEYVLEGDLTIRGVTKPVRFDIVFNGASVDPWGNDRIGFEGTATVNRRDWDLSWNVALDAGGILVGEKVKLTLDVSATRSA